MMVNAILEGRKTQTRTVLSGNNSLFDGSAQIPYGKDGVTWDDFDWKAAWVDSGPSPVGNPGPYLHVPLPKMKTVHRLYPRWRIGDVLWVRETTLEIVILKVERLQDIDENSARNEGVRAMTAGQDEHGSIKTYRTGFVYLWNEIYRKRGYGWETNPWVWVIEFKRK